MRYGGEKTRNFSIFWHGPKSTLRHYRMGAERQGAECDECAVRPGAGAGCLTRGAG